MSRIIQRSTGALVALSVLALVPSMASAKVFVLPHVLEKSGRINIGGQGNPADTFDTRLEFTYTAGYPIKGEGPSPEGGALVNANKKPKLTEVSIRLYDAQTSEPFKINGVNVCDPCSIARGTEGEDRALGVTHRVVRTTIEDIILKAVPGIKAIPPFDGYAIVETTGDEANVIFNSFVVNSHSTALDFSVFGFDPVPISAAVNSKATVAPAAVTSTPASAE